MGSVGVFLDCFPGWFDRIHVSRQMILVQDVHPHIFDPGSAGHLHHWTAIHELIIPTSQVSSFDFQNSCIWASFKVLFPQENYISDATFWKPIIHPAQVWKVKFWMKLLGSKTTKRSVIWGNTPKIWRFKTGHLRLGRKAAKSLLVRKYRDASGRARFVGKKHQQKKSALLEV